eukprot:1262712-Prymnesium_polylepis.2
MACTAGTVRSKNGSTGAAKATGNTYARSLTQPRICVMLRGGAESAPKRMKAKPVSYGRWMRYISA